MDADSGDLRGRREFAGGFGGGHTAGRGKIDLTIGSALDIFGGTGVRYDDVVKFNRRQDKKA